MTEQDINLIIRLWESGEPKCVIVKMLPYKPYHIEKKILELRQNGVLKGRSGKTSTKTHDKVLDAYNNGITNPYEIADMLGLSHHTIKEHLNKANLNRTRPKHNYITCDKTRLIRADLESGIKAREIAKKYGVSTQWVHFVKNKYKENENDE